MRNIRICSTLFEIKSRLTAYSTICRTFYKTRKVLTKLTKAFLKLWRVRVQICLRLTWLILFKLLVLLAVSRTHWTQDQPITRTLPTEGKADVLVSNLTIALFRRAKILHDVYLAITVIGFITRVCNKITFSCSTNHKLQTSKQRRQLRGLGLRLAPDNAPIRYVSCSSFPFLASVSFLHTTFLLLLHFHVSPCTHPQYQLYMLPCAFYTRIYLFSLFLPLCFILQYFHL